MKKAILFAAAIAALVSCNKAENAGDASFQKGQKVTLSITANTSDTRVSTTLNPETGSVGFTWEENDEIKVAVGNSTATFILVNGKGTKTGVFSGEMPASGSSFSVQYPVEDPDLTEQTWTSDEALPHKKMLLKGEGTTEYKTFWVSADKAGLRINLYGNAQVGKIVVTPSGTLPAMTLTVEDGVTLKEAKADSMAFILAVPAGEYSFTAEVFDNSATPESIAKFTTSAEQTFTAGGILNMPAQEIKVTESADYYPGTTMKGIKIGGITWAPVNCGYDATHPYGLLYQWGRMDGQGYDGESTAPTFADTFQGINGDYTGTPALSRTTFYKGTESSSSTYDYDWIKNGSHWYWNGCAENKKVNPEYYIKKSDKDPCPEGWRVPTYTELVNLYGLNDAAALYTSTDGIKGCYFNGTASCTSTSAEPKLFLPAAGYRSCNYGVAAERGSTGDYWSASPIDFPDNTVDDKSAGTSPYVYCLEFNQDEGNRISGMAQCERAYGFSVRCVKGN